MNVWKLVLTCLSLEKAKIFLRQWDQAEKSQTIYTEEKTIGIATDNQLIN